MIDDPLHWQPLVAENGTVQQFISPHWERVRPFALASAGQFDLLPWMAPPDIQRPGSLAYEKNVDELLQFTRELNEAKKLIVEYWADGPHSELPPGHWGLFAQFVSQRDHHDIDQDAKMFFAMHNASFDAGIVGWHLKRKYDGVRPITAIRLLKKGSIVLGWGGPGRPVEPIPAEKWTPYNPGSNLTPSFPGFVSGHSIFSRASATVLTLFTGSDHLGYTTIIAPGFGRVEPGVPLIPTTLRFATFSDAADEAGLSRFYAGIHFTDDNTIGQRLGELIGNIAFRKAQDYFRGVAALSAGN
ncbi:MAG: vanadium-dependent haloperoxidase [Herminiimonas sp.]|nr:vanadium-dependent haloperoxidase [Herminiimonas sp.]